MFSFKDAQTSFQCESVKIVHDQGESSATYKVCSSPLDDTIYIQVTKDNDKDGIQKNGPTKWRTEPDMVIDIAGFIEKTYQLSNDTKLERYTPIEYDSTRTICKLSTVLKHIRYCVEQGTTDRCNKYRTMLLTEDQELTIALKDTGSKYLINDVDQTTEWLSSTSNKRLRRAAFSRRPPWCPPQFICHGRINITKNMKKINFGFTSSQQQQAQLNSPAYYDVNLQVKSTVPIDDKPYQPKTQSRPQQQKPQQQQPKFQKKKLIIVFHEANQLVKRRQRDLQPEAMAEQRTTTQKNLSTVLANIDRCFLAIKFMRRMQ